MNKQLSALMSKLNWQLHETEQQLELIKKKITEIEAQLADVAQKINSASVAAKQIVPEHEIASMCFIMTKQQLHDELMLHKNELNSQQVTLNSKILRLKTEINMLEKYQQAQKTLRIKQQIATEQNAMDEWIIQRKQGA